MDRDNRKYVNRNPHKAVKEKLKIFALCASILITGAPTAKIVYDSGPGQKNKINEQTEKMSMELGPQRDKIQSIIKDALKKGKSSDYVDNLYAHAKQILTTVAIREVAKGSSLEEIKKTIENTDSFIEDESYMVDPKIEPTRTYDLEYVNNSINGKYKKISN